MMWQCGVMGGLKNTREGSGEQLIPIKKQSRCQCRSGVGVHAREGRGIERQKKGEDYHPPSEK